MPRPGGHAGPIVTALALVGSPCLRSHRGDCLRGGLRGASLPPTGWPPARQEVFLVFPMVSFTWSQGPHAPSRVSPPRACFSSDPKRQVRAGADREAARRNVYAGKGPPQQRTHASHLPLVPAERANARASTRRTMAATLAATTIPDDTRPTRSHPIDRDRSPPIVCRKLRSKCCFVEAVDRVLACGSELIRRRESPSRSIDRSEEHHLGVLEDHPSTFSTGTGRRAAQGILHAFRTYEEEPPTC